MSPLISIIVPVYNAQKTLQRCIDSLLGQTYSSLEIILVNDGSKDDSLSICQYYASKDKRIHVIDIENQGVSNARNLGIAQSNGEFIVFIDSDDYVEDDYLKSLYENHSDNRISVCAIKELYNHKTLINRYKDEPISKVDKHCFVELYNHKLIGSPCNKLYQSKIIKGNSLFFDKRYYLGEDLLFNLSYMKKIDLEGFNVINDPKYNYIIDDTIISLSKTFERNEIDMQHILFQELISFIENNLKKPQLVPAMKDAYYYALLYRFDGMYHAHKGKEFNQFAREILLKNSISSLKEILKISKNYKLKIKLMIACFVNFDVYYKFFGYKKGV